MMTFAKPLFAAALTAQILAAGPLTAQDAAADAPKAPEVTTQDLANGTPFGDWVVNCEAITVNRTQCSLLQEQSLRETNALVARFIALPTDEDSAVLVAQVPMGVFLPGGAVFRPENDDSGAQSEMVWQRCYADICEAAIALDAAALGAVTDADALLFGYRVDAEAEPIITRVDVSQLADGLAALRSAN